MILKMSCFWVSRLPKGRPSKSRQSISRWWPALLLIWGCGSPEPGGMPATQTGERAGPEPAAELQPAPTRGIEIFVDRAADTGLRFDHLNGRADEFHMAEILGSGAALFDYDNDGDLDAYLVQSGKLAEEGRGAADRLYQNRLMETGKLIFEDVSERSGDLGSGYGMGVAVGDIDNDGFVDLYVTHFGSNQMLHNQQDGTFRDITEPSGTDDPRWSVSSTFWDYDLDGKLDLFVGNYVDFTLTASKQCFSKTSERDYCGPLSYQPSGDRLFRNVGASKGVSQFEDTTAQAGVLSGAGPALGTVSADFNGDHWPDLFVANDATANLMWINDRSGRFENQALLAGTAFNLDGEAEASMGLVAGDFDGDGDEDLFMTHLQDETNTLYSNDGSGLFTDQTLGSGLDLSSRQLTGFGTGWIDYDNDGLLDLLIVNGAVRMKAELQRAGDPFPLHEPNQLLRNLGGGRVEDISARAGRVFELSEVSRGAAFGDVDNDGDTDVLVVNNGGPARLMINAVGQDTAWLGFRLLRNGRDDYGARVKVSLEDGRTLWRRVGTDGSYASAGDPRLLIGVGDSKVKGVEVFGSDGRRHELMPDQWSLRSYRTIDLSKPADGAAGGTR